jgi:hypothetical protein
MLLADQTSGAISPAGTGEKSRYFLISLVIIRASQRTRGLPVHALTVVPASPVLFP